MRVRAQVNMDRGQDIGFVKGMYYAASDFLKAILPESWAKKLDDAAFLRIDRAAQALETRRKQQELMDNLKLPQGHAADRIRRGAKEHEEWLEKFNSPFMNE